MKRLFIFVILIISSVAKGQLITNTDQSPQNLVQNALLGPGVIVSNVVFNGSNSAIGSFSATGTNLGIDQGIVMTTGTVLNNGSGPQGPNNQANCGVDNGFGGFGLLSNLIGLPTFNAAILEFDFVPFSDTVRFKYVFGSDEYPEFVGSLFNDVFAFFITGPGIAGMQNIAQLPNNGGVVSINNVNSINNSPYFNVNGNGTNAPYNNSPFYIQYDGFTKPLEAVSRVQCGETYHLIIAIADVGDGFWDSGIFLEANSLSSQTPIDVSFTLSQQLYTDPSWLAEGCASATVTVQRSGNLNNTLTIPITVSGSAQNLVDYFGIPNTITFAAGQNTSTFIVNTLPDNLVEGLETILINFNVADPCGNLTPILLTLMIQDVDPLLLSLPDVSVVCPGDLVTITANLSGGVPPYDYLWSTGSTANSITVIANTTGTVSLIVIDGCLNTEFSSGQIVTDTSIITVPVYPELSLIVSNDITEICPFIPQTIFASASGGSGSFTYTWRNNNSIVGVDDSLVVNPSQTSQYIVTVVDNCGSTLTDTITYTILSMPLVVYTSPVIRICPGDSAFISASALGGYGNYYFLWPSTGETSSGIWVQPTASALYEVIVSDECQTFSVSGFCQVLVVKPVADFGILSTLTMEGLPVSFINQTQNGYGYAWFFGDGTGSTDIHPVHTYTSEGTYYVTLIATDITGCVDTITKPVIIQEEFYIYIPNTFIPGKNGINRTFSGSFIGVEWIKIEIFNRWGELVFESEALNFAWDGQYNGNDIQSGSFPWKLYYKTKNLQTAQMSGHVNIIR